MSEWIKKINWKYVIVMLIGNVILGLGIAIFKLSGLGNDPFSGMVMALSDRTGIDYPVFLIIVNMIVFVFEIIFGRKLIGLGTFVNAVLLGYIVSFFYNIILCLEPTQMVQRVLTVCVGVVVTSLGVSMYQLSRQGVTPYDSVSLIMVENGQRFPTSGTEFPMMLYAP